MLFFYLKYEIYFKFIKHLHFVRLFFASHCADVDLSHQSAENVAKEKLVTTKVTK